MRQGQDKLPPRVMTTVQDRRSSHVRAATVTRFKHFELQRLRQFSSIVPDRTLYEAPDNIDQLKILQVAPKHSVNGKGDSDASTYRGIEDFKTRTGTQMKRRAQSFIGHVGGRLAET